MLAGLVSSEASLLDVDMAAVSPRPHKDTLLRVLTFLMSLRVSRFSPLIRTSVQLDHGSS